MKGLKQLVEEALAEKPAPLPPVTVSDEARRALSTKMREWSGWTDSTVRIGKPTASPFADCDHSTHTFTANADILVRNPNRVLLTVTPFRLRQEAVLTGCLLHEAGHARHSHWLPRTPEEAAAKPIVHSDGTIPTKQTVTLARLMEEARVEGLMARDAGTIGAAGLDWTMRASAAHLVPTTNLSAHADQAVMDLVTSWALRAGRQIALAHYTDHEMRSWVTQFTSLLHQTIVAHLSAQPVLEGQDPDIGAHDIVGDLRSMIVCQDDTGPSMIDLAREVLLSLFPETPPEEMPEAGEGCSSEESESEAGDEGEGDEAGQDGEGDTEPEDPGSGEDPGAGDTGAGDEPDGEDSDSQAEGEGSSEGDSEGEPSEGEPSEGATSSTGSGTDTESPLAKALREMEEQAKSEATEEAEEDAATQPSEEDSLIKSAGTGGPGSRGVKWRSPTKEEREVQKGAEQFLRGMINPTESAKVMLTDSPSATVDGGALAAWRASGGTRDPRFFLRTRRNVEPSPPVKIAILVDVSGSMDSLQAPSALLSWALASAATDLRNFAGRGQQVESVLIHWGSTARVIQRNGEMLPGIREVVCTEGTSALDEAHRLVEEEIPGFFDITEQPVNRLLVQFTDWELAGWCRNEVAPQIQQALEAGVNMLTVAPRDYSPRRSDLEGILAGCKIQRGASRVMQYNRMFPSQVWDTAAQSLAAASHGGLPGHQDSHRPAPFEGF
jgi:hypothetical protein